MLIFCGYTSKVASDLTLVTRSIFNAYFNKFFLQYKLSYNFDCVGEKVKALWRHWLHDLGSTLTRATLLLPWIRRYVNYFWFFWTSSKFRGPKFESAVSPNLKQLSQWKICRSSQQSASVTVRWQEDKYATTTTTFLKHILSFSEDLTEIWRHYIFRDIFK